MRLPFLQVQFEETRRRAGELSALTGHPVAMWIGWQVALWDWGLGLSCNERPTGRCDGTGAWARAAGAIGWDGSPEALASALVEVGLVEQLDGAIRVRGVEERYGRAWDESVAAKERASKSRKEREEKERARTFANVRVPCGNVPRKTETETETETETKNEEDRNHAPPAESRLALVTPPVEPPKAKPKRAKATDTPEVLELREAWNSITTPPIARWTAGRADVALEALKRRPLAEWREVFRLVEASAFCRGSTGFVASIDFVLRPEGKKPETALRVLEGAYASAPPSSAKATTGAAYRTPGATVTDSDTSWEADPA